MIASQSQNENQKIFHLNLISFKSEEAEVRGVY
jgi:hypothetical protein